MNILYVASDKDNPTELCPGSIVCVNISEKLPEDFLQIQNCDVLRQKNAELPDWLNGTPIFINSDEEVPYRGKDAIKKLQAIFRNYEHHLKQQETANMKSQISNNSKSHRSQQQQQQRQYEPQQQRQKEESHAQFSLNEESLDDAFKINADPNAMETSSGKITEQDLQKYMEQRNQSKASQHTPSPQQQN